VPKQKTQPRKIPFLVLLVASGFFLLISAALLFTQNTASQATSLPPAASGHGEETYPEIERVSIADAKSALDAGLAVFVDVRIADAYNVNHIPGALNLPLGEVETRLGELDPNQWIITYCT
jgi:3-mercaptopyruvate sulfurtransferase SseA